MSFNTTTPNYFRYWGKASRDDNSYHLLVYHSLDVAAVGYELLSNHPVYLNYIASISGLEKKDVLEWFTFFLALHDIGKFGDSFQNLNPPVAALLGRESSDRAYSARHDTLGWLIWREHLRQWFIDRGLMTATGSSRRQNLNQPVDFWLAAMVGHHGMPPNPNDLIHPTTTYLAPDRDFAAVSDFCESLISVLLPDNASFPACDLATTKLASWWISGLAVLSDWLGSNTRYFPYQSAPISLEDYWQEAKTKAARAIQETELLSNKVALPLGLSDLVETGLGVAPIATPLQNQVVDWGVSEGAHLFILEDVTGAGKTEAAVLLAHRLMNFGLASSLYFALPTMATANSMYARMRDIYHKLFTENSSPSLILAHGARDMSIPFRQSVIPPASASAADYGDGTATAGAHCSAWLADNRKKALLADIGIGTIDQALMGILPARHQSLRLLGLLNKILIVDEVHACDAYMHELLCALLRAHAAAGGSAILLSATLPHKQRQALLNAYAEGKRWNKEEIRAVDEKSYPLMTSLNVKGLKEQVVATRECVRRAVKVELVHEQQAVEGLLEKTIENAQCACWIRNTVKDAVEAYQYIVAKHPDWKVDLFHARYALADRIDIEAGVVGRFDKESTHESRKGRILIATQVVEQSLDLDFDVLISDLAPIDLIIQRAGRLRRHARDHSGNPIQGDDLRGDAVLYVLSPKVNESPAAGWYAHFFPSAQKVYPHHGQLWLTARILQQQGAFRMPDDARSMIEGVYADESQNQVPEALLGLSLDAEGGDRANASIARLNALKMAVGYSDAATNRWWDEAKTPSRLGEETTIVYLARFHRGQLSPWSDDAEHPWQMSAVSMRTYWIAKETEAGEIDQALIDECKQNLPAKGKWGVLLPLLENSSGDWFGAALNEKQEPVQVCYNPKLGLKVITESTKEK